MNRASKVRAMLMLLASVLVAAISISATRGQAYTFTNKSVDYVIEFPSSQWRALPSSSIVSPRTRKEFLYTDGDNVRLIVRRKIVDVTVTPSDMVRRRQIKDRRLPGYIMVNNEDFTGQLSGAKFSYEYTKGGKPMMAILYYLEEDNRIVYSLYFTGTRDALQTIHPQADSIARSFRLKKPRNPRS